MDGLSFNLSQWILQTIAMMATALFIPRLKVDGPIPAFLTVLALSFVNAHLWSTALFLEIPDSVTKQTLTLLLANGVIFWIVVKILPGIECEGFLPALVAPVVFTGTMVLISRYGDSVDWVNLGKAAVRLIIELKSYIQQRPPPATAPDDTVAALIAVPNRSTFFDLFSFPSLV